MPPSGETLARTILWDLLALAAYHYFETPPEVRAAQRIVAAESIVAEAERALG